MINDKIRNAKEKKLKKLDLSNQKLVQIPEEVFELQQIESLNLSNNQLSVIPEVIGQLSNLDQLDLSNNRLSTIPQSITKLHNLTQLNLVGNPLEKPVIEIAAHGIKAIRDYFRQLNEGEDYIYEAKLLIIGEGGAGKTTLAKKIANPYYQLQREEASTEGIDVTTWKFYMPEIDREFRVNIWDFGGQEIYHATHQFFLTKRSMYALVVDTRKEDTDFYYWMNVVELLSDNSPILIIKNEKQDRHREININALRGQFSNLKETIATNLATNRGLDNVISNIQDYIKKLPHIGQVLPKTWVKIRKALEEDPRNYISLQEYFDICEVNEITKTSDKLQLSSYLHDLGVCLHFQEKEDSLLYKTVILKPEWGTDAVYKVLENKQVINNQGFFNSDNLQEIWHEDKYTSMRGELLELMKNFQLCYEIPEQKNKFIAPQLLTENQPKYNWNESKNLILRYTYEFMPKGIITRLIVIMHRWIEQHKYVWKMGLVIDKDDTKAEIIEYYDKREIKIRVTGKYKRDLLNNVTYELEKIHYSYHRLKYKKLIPCNCSLCKNSQSPYFYSFNILRKFVADKQNYIQCQNSYQMVNILKLIDDAVDFKQSNIRNDAQVNIYHDQDKDSTDFTQPLTKNFIHSDNYFIEDVNNEKDTTHIQGIEIKDEIYSLNISDDIQEKKIDKDRIEYSSTNTEIIETQLEENYRLATAEYEKKYKAALKSKDEELAIYKRQVEELKEIIQSLSKTPIVIRQISEDNQQ